MVKFGSNLKRCGGKKMNKDNKEMCGFYINDAHLSTMIFPYIMKNINERIITIFENDIDKYINKLLKNTNFKNEIKEKIENINWKKGKEEDFNNILDNSYIIIAGKINYIDKVRKALNDNIKNNQNITIVKCYDIENLKLDINNIIKENEYIINTAGEMKREDYLRENKSKIN